MIERVRQYEPLFGNWWVDQLIGSGSFGRVYRIKREEFGEVYLSALKIITIPADANETEQLLLEGMDQTSVSTYYESMVKELSREIRLMSHLRAHSNIVSYEDHLIKAHENGTSWDILIRMELMTRLNTYLREHAPTRSDIIRLGTDLARALDLCQKYNIIHRDIKPDNIFVSPNGDFKLGDFGIARQMERTTGNMSRKGTHFYMAPEVYLEKPYASNVDIYSLGIVMYRLLNGNRLPFMPDAPNPILPQDRDLALLKRIGGEKLPLPRDAQGRLGEIVLKACAHDPAQRYTNPDQLMSELNAILYEEEDSRLIYPLGDAMQLTPTAADQQSATNLTRRSIEIHTELPVELSDPYLPIPSMQKPSLGQDPVSLIAKSADVVQTKPDDDEKTCSSIFIHNEPSAKNRIVAQPTAQDPSQLTGIKEEIRTDDVTSQTPDSPDVITPPSSFPVVPQSKKRKRKVMWIALCCLLFMLAALGIAKIIRSAAIDTQKTYPVVAISNDNLYGSVNGGSIYAAGTSITLTAIPNEGYKFISWDDGQRQPEREIRVRGEVELEAIFEPISYRIIFHGGDSADGTGTETLHHYGESFKLPSNSFQLTGMKFAGWSREADGQIDFLDEQKVTNLAAEDGALIELFAVWVDDHLVSISLAADQTERGQVIGGGTYEKGELVTITAEPNAGYQFVGWSDQSDQPSRKLTAAEDLSLVAYFEPKLLAICLNGNGGTVDLDKFEIGLGMPVPDLPVPTRKGYTFAGWFTTETGGNPVKPADVFMDIELAALFAHWQANTFTVTFDAKGGSISIKEQSVTFGSPYQTLPTPSKQGYTFVGWFSSESGDEQIESSDPCQIETSHILYARWIGDAYKLTYHANGGTVSPGSKTIRSGELYGQMPVPQRKGYDFQSWSASQTSSQPIVANDVFQQAGNQTIYAQWKFKTYTISFNANGGKSSETSKTASFGVAIGTLPDATRTGHTMRGWYTSQSGGTRITADTVYNTDANQTFYAQWQANTYTVTLNGNSGSVTPSSIQLPYGQTYSQLPTPNRQGYDFTGWFTASSGGSAVSASQVFQQTRDQTLYAQWKVKTYTITFDTAGGSSSVSSKPAAFGVAIGALPEATKTGHTLLGWFTSASGGTKISTDTIYNLNANQTLYAQWKVNTYTIALNGNGGSVTPSGIQVTYGQTYSQLPTPSRQGYNFSGWFTASSGGTTVNSSQAFQGTSDQMLYAQWQVYTYTVTFNANGGSNAPASQTKTYQVNLTLSSSTPSRSGYDFRGWATSSDSLAVAYAAGATYQENANLNLYAIWGERALYLGSTSSYAQLDVGLCNYYPNGATSYSFTFYTGGSIPANGAIYQYGSAKVGMSIYFSNARIAVYTVFTQDGVAYKTTHVGDYALSPNRKYTVDMSFTYSNKRIQLTIRDASGSQLSSQTFTGYNASNVTTSGIFGANGTSYNKTTAPQIYLLKATLNGTHYSTGQYQLRTFAFNAASTALGTTSVTSNNIKMTCSGTSVQYR